MGPFKHKQKQSHEFWWSQLLPCGNSEAVHGRPGHNGPPPAQNRVKVKSTSPPPVFTGEKGPLKVGPPLFKRATTSLIRELFSLKPTHLQHRKEQPLDSELKSTLISGVHYYLSNYRVQFCHFFFFSLFTKFKIILNMEPKDKTKNRIVVCIVVL